MRGNRNNIDNDANLFDDGIEDLLNKIAEIGLVGNQFMVSATIDDRGTHSLNRSFE